MKTYRLLTGPDNKDFCQRVSEALAAGWTLYGSPTMTYNKSTMQVICGQAVVKDTQSPNTNKPS